MKEINYSFKGACPDQFKEFLQQKGWKIEKLKKDKPGFKAINPTNTSDIIKIIEVDPSKLKDGTDIISVKKVHILKEAIKNGSEFL
ncbi:hypothetical protein Aasi_0550 [Candidatus Amoebophilus asiaticus 5a2]|uniref:Uncharacterized protein n=1 Tax=Amoebophilus asiaticus (strain 5a2) TaxID=452471 RepID=B3ERU9_AMOA5|nr:hypothetical protein [Candidatus Amoebophilus asiaticus]ACE05951.1 hypothetical protein Aasi_0550 [Candidatus Amoebophilus asiaticus 5a2]